MAAISKALAASLDQLASCISKAEEFIASSLPTATNVAVKVDRDGDEFSPCVSYWLEYRDGRFVKVDQDEETGDEVIRPLMEISIPDRQKYSQFIPQFIQEATAAMEKLPTELATNSSEILDSIKIAKIALNMK